MHAMDKETPWHSSFHLEATVRTMSNIAAVSKVGFRDWNAEAAIIASMDVC
jgi:hypothetical protein